MVNTNIGLI